MDTCEIAKCTEKDYTKHMKTDCTKTTGGQVRQKRGDTLVGTVEKKYGVDLGYRSDAQLHTVLKKEGVPSLSKLLKMTRPNK